MVRQESEAEVIAATAKTAKTPVKEPAKDPAKGTLAISSRYELFRLIDDRGVGLVRYDHSPFSSPVAP